MSLHFKQILRYSIYVFLGLSFFIFIELVGIDKPGYSIGLKILDSLFWSLGFTILVFLISLLVIRKRKPNQIKIKRLTRLLFEVNLEIASLNDDNSPATFLQRSILNDKKDRIKSELKNEISKEKSNLNQT